MIIKKIEKEATWPIRSIAMYPDKPLEHVVLDIDSTGQHYGLFIGHQSDQETEEVLETLDDQLVSVISLFVENNQMQFRKFATLVDEQGKGYGSYLLKWVIDYCIKEKIETLWCNARMEKRFYYKHLGFCETDKTFRRGEIDYIIMEMLIE